MPTEQNRCGGCNEIIPLTTEQIMVSGTHGWWHSECHKRDMRTKKLFPAKPRYRCAYCGQRVRIRWDAFGIAFPVRHPIGGPTCRGYHMDAIPE